MVRQQLNQDFRHLYDVSNALTLGGSSLRFGRSAEKSAALALRGETVHNGYHVRRIRSRYEITFGRPENAPKIRAFHGMEDPGRDLEEGVLALAEFMIPPASEDVLLLCASKDTRFGSERPLLALRYGIYRKELVIAYAQTPSEVSLGDYLMAKEDLRVRPHDFLVAQFLARTAPILDKFPETAIHVAPHYLSKPVYPALRDRFFDRDYALNPRRQRVQDILGADNTWLQYAVD